MTPESFVEEGDSFIEKEARTFIRSHVDNESLEELFECEHCNKAVALTFYDLDDPETKRDFDLARKLFSEAGHTVDDRSDTELCTCGDYTVAPLREGKLIVNLFPDLK